MFIEHAAGSWPPRRSELETAPARRLTLESDPDTRPAGGRASSRNRPRRTTVFEDIALAHREIYALYEIAQAMGTSLGVSDTMALISSKLSNLVPFSSLRAVPLRRRDETLRCRFATGVEADLIGSDDGAQRPRPHRLGRAQPPAARQRAAERRLRGRRPDRRSTTPAVGAGLPAGLQRAVHRHARRLSHASRTSTPTITAACSTASPSRPRRSSTTRSCSSRRRKTR